MTDPRDLRAGNADRDHVVEALQRAADDGRLAEDELAARIDAARAARTFGDLDQVVGDLPIPPPSIELAPVSEPRFPAVQDSPPVPTWPTGVPLDLGPIGASPENPLVIDAGWSSDKREGDWVIPQFLRLRGGAGSIHLDCTEAITQHNVIHLWVDGDLGSITIVVPEGWAADADGVRKSLGSISVKVPKEPTMGRPVLVVNGSMGMGSFTVRPPNWFERRRLEKKLR
ncbi:DUF1707 SHOCT-like domain-containing protein [Granulicoccus sp. GXG6511]|uniref:DUF1707 SHOCT-like domain-containing protein n=1 Tax=Granulicoccus sp. GXG6511 TaxID=3381351 RepID=UPI003D7CA15E